MSTCFLNFAQSIFREVTVDPLLFCFYFGFAIFSSASFPAFYGKVCLNIFQSGPDVTAICDSLDSDQSRQDQVQHDASYWLIYNELLKFVPTFFATMYFGSYGDKNGRKVPLVLALCSMTVYMYLYLTVTALPVFQLYTVTILVFLAAFVPPNAVVVMSVFSYLADRIEEDEKLTFRYTVLTAFWSLAYVIGGYVGAVLLDLYSLTDVMLCAQVICTLTFFATLIFMPNTKSIPTTPADAKEHSSSGFWRETAQYFKSAFLTISKRRPRHGRTYLILICAMMIIYASEDGGVDVVISLFTFHAPLSWSPGILSVA